MEFLFVNTGKSEYCYYFTHQVENYIIYLIKLLNTNILRADTPAARIVWDNSNGYVGN